MSNSKAAKRVLFGVFVLGVFCFACEAHAGTAGISDKDIDKIYGWPSAIVSVTQKAPKIDGMLNDQAWSKAKRLETHLRDHPKYSKLEKNRTFIRAVSDKQNLYIGFECEEENMDKVGKGDTVEMFFDVGHTEDYKYFQIIVNIEGDVRHTAMLKSDSSWKPKGLVARAHKADKSWTVEVKIPFADFGIDPAGFPKLWGANFWRDRPQAKDEARHYSLYSYTAWSQNPEGDGSHVPNMFGHLYFERGNAVPSELLALLKGQGKSPRALGLKLWDPEDKPIPIQEVLRRKAKFASKPTVKEVKGKWVVEFAVKEPTDATVWISDAAGKMVRHIASGMLGENPPEPFHKGTLKQKLIWDGNDDDGKRVSPGKYSVHVALGLEAKFDRIIPIQKNTERIIKGLAVDKRGNLYVYNGIDFQNRSWKGPVYIDVYDRSGKYLRQIMPFPSNLPLDKVKGAGVVKLASDKWIPAVYHCISRNLYPEMMAWKGPVHMVHRSDGHLVFANRVRTDTHGGLRATGWGRRIMVLGTDGSAEDGFLGPMISRQQTRGNVYIALSPDEKHVYATGLRGLFRCHSSNASKIPTWDEMLESPPHNVVYRLTWDAADFINSRDPYRKPFIGELMKAGKGEHLLDDPRGIAVDRAGNIYVSDCGNDRIAVFNEKGKLLYEIPVPGPAQIEIDRKREKIYVMSMTEKTCRLLKFSDLKSGKIEAEMDLPFAYIGKPIGTPKSTRLASVFCVDTRARRPIIWISKGTERSRIIGSGGVIRIREVLQIIDRGDRFEDKGVVIRLHDPSLAQRDFYDPGGHISYLDPDREELYIGQRTIIDGRTGKYLRHAKTPRFRCAGETVIGKDGKYYVMGNIMWGTHAKEGIYRFNLDGTPAPFPKTGSNFINKFWGGHGNSNRGLAAAPDGTIYIPHTHGSYDNKENLVISQINPEGDVLRYKFIDIGHPNPGPQGPSGACVKVDRKGYVYVGAAVKPRDQASVKYFQGRISKKLRSYPKPWFMYRQGYGSVVKFKPSGGSIKADKDGDIAGTLYSGIKRCKGKGVVWLYPLYPMPNADVQASVCNCWSPRFDLDRFDRLFVPDAARFSVSVIDSNANTILRIGSYGNKDCKGPGSLRPKPDIGLAWPLVVWASDEACYIIDAVNDRVVRAALGYRKHSTCTVKVKFNIQRSRTSRSTIRKKGR